jgi:hypothetical protein
LVLSHETSCGLRVTIVAGYGLQGTSKKSYFTELPLEIRSKKLEVRRGIKAVAQKNTEKNGVAQRRHREKGRGERRKGKES